MSSSRRERRENRFLLKRWALGVNPTALHRALLLSAAAKQNTKSGVIAMYTFTVNGQEVTAAKNQKLLPFMRDELRLLSVKDGCSAGACGTCMILVDGRAARACIFTTEKVQGKTIVTVEGLSPRERGVYAYAFSAAGAVQCGFCTPGMVISAKGLLDKEPSPTLRQVKEALKGNICRCTGYAKIEQAVLLAADVLREGLPVPRQDADNGGAAPVMPQAVSNSGEQAAQQVTSSREWDSVAERLGLAQTETGRVGHAMQRVDAEAKTLGTAKYANDIYLEGMLHGGAVRSAYPRARVLAIHTSEALALPDVVCAITAADLPGHRKVGHLKKDQYVLVGEGEITTYLGDAIVLLAARTKDGLEAAKAAVKIEYEELPGVFSVADAMAEGAPHVQEEGNLLSRQYLKRGNADAQIAKAAHVVTQHYTTPPTEHAFLEPETAVAVPDGAGGLVIYSGDQGIYQTKHECTEATGLPEEKVRVIAMTVGGGLGGKEDMSVQHHAALLAQHTGKPVKLAMSRQESILCHPKRHAMEMEFTTACDADGNLLALKATILSDSGAFASLGGPVLQRACTHAAGPYHFTDIEIEGRAYYTNNPPGGAFRGFGVTQSCFAMESNLNLLAKAVGISPWEIRYRNAIRPGETLPNGQIADPSTALAETLEAVKDYMEDHPKAGIACAIKNSGLGVGVPDVGRCRLAVEDGCVVFHSSAACIGQGIATVATQIICETTGLMPRQMRYHQPDTSLAPDCGNTTASRQTVFMGEAARRAALALKEALDGQALAELNGQESRPDCAQQKSNCHNLSNLNGQIFEGEFACITDPMGSDKKNPVSHVAYGYATHVVDLDEEGRIAKVIAAHDVGRAINPLNVEGQVEGGVVMSLGYALTEDYPLDKGKPLAQYGTLGLLRATQVPAIETIIVEKNDSELACGAKGIGEICSIPTPPAVALAYELRDGIHRTRLPLEGTPYSRRKG